MWQLVACLVGQLAKCRLSTRTDRQCHSRALHTSLSIGIWQRSAFHRRKWQQINKMDKRDVILSDQAACRYDENNKYSLLYSSCHHQSPIIFTKTGFQNLCQIELYQSSVTVFHKQATNPNEKRTQARCWEFTRRPNTNDRCCRDGSWPPTGWLQLLGALLPFPPSPEICPKANVWRDTKGRVQKIKMEI